ncbi:MAG: signal peptidase I, partial [Pseudomonadota bacterium]|nr:signal peptidase I [Pseudomonadota bacterium]
MKNIFFKGKEKNKKLKNNITSLFYAIVAALIIRSFFYEPFSIPSGSMYPNLKVGDYLFVSKFSYGFSRHSLPFSIPIFPGRIFSKDPKRGEIIVFKTPEDNRTDYIKRVVGLPGDSIEIKKNIIFINGIKIETKKKN